MSIDLRMKISTTVSIDHSSAKYHSENMDTLIIVVYGQDGTLTKMVA